MGQRLRSYKPPSCCQLLSYINWKYYINWKFNCHKGHTRIGPPQVRRKTASTCRERRATVERIPAFCPEFCERSPILCETLKKQIAPNLATTSRNGGYSAKL